jgi:tetratricopeptide (TPR) repeat protein
MSGVDPKDRIAVANSLHDAIVAVEDAAFARAVPLLEKVIASEPAIPIAQLNLGVAYARQQQYARAIAPLTRAVALQPDDFRANLLLGRILTLRGDKASALPYLQTAVSVDPSSAEAKQFLADAVKR